MSTLAGTYPWDQTKVWDLYKSVYVNSAHVLHTIYRNVRLDSRDIFRIRHSSKDCRFLCIYAQSKHMTTYLTSCRAMYNSSTAVWHRINEDLVGILRHAPHLHTQSSKFRGCGRCAWIWILRSMTSQMCSMGFSSGELGGQPLNWNSPLCSSNLSSTLLAFTRGVVLFKDVIATICRRFCFTDLDRLRWGRPFPTHVFDGDFTVFSPLFVDTHNSRYRAPDTKRCFGETRSYSILTIWSLSKLPVSNGFLRKKISRRMYLT